MVDIQKIRHYLLEKAQFNANLYAEHKYEGLRKIVLELFRDSSYGHDTVQTILNRLLASERKSSFVLEGGVAIPHVVLEEDMIGDMKVGWFRSQNGIVFTSLVEPVHIILCMIGTKEHLPLVMGRGFELTRDSNFRMKFILANTNQYLYDLVKNALNLEDSHSKIITQDLFASENTCRTEITIINKLGLHGRACAKLVTMAVQFKCQVRIVARYSKNYKKDRKLFAQIREKKRKLFFPNTCLDDLNIGIFTDDNFVVANGKSIMGTMFLALGKGECLELIANGPDAQEAIDAMIDLFKNKFGEDE